MKASPNFPPPVPAVEIACDELAEAGDFAARWDARAAEQLREREEFWGFVDIPPEIPRRNVANLLVRSTHPDYRLYVAWSERADPRHWRWDEEGRGIWVGLGALDEIRSGPGARDPWKALSAETLRAMYPKRSDPDDGDQHATVRQPDDPV
jgi:hypothetical protein